MHVERSVERLTGVGSAILGFSGGKDSVACMELAKMAGIRPTLVWVNTGATLPHMDRYIREVTAGFELVEVKTDQAAFWRQAGIPSRVVPMVNHTLGRLTNPELSDRPRIVDWVTCHLHLQTQPFWNEVVRRGCNLVIDGQREQEVSLPRKSPLPNVALLEPIWEWTTEQVYAFLKERGVPLPEQYPEVVSSLDCWNCPAFASREQLVYLRRAYPEQAQELQATLETLDGEIERERKRTITAVLN